MEKYKCEICGKKHNIFGRIESPMPLFIEIPEEEHAERIQVEDFLYIIDRKQVFTNGIIWVKLNGTEDWLSWKVWIEIDFKDFQKKVDNMSQFNEDPIFFGKLKSPILFYDNIENLKVQFRVFASDDVRIEVIWSTMPKQQPISIIVEESVVNNYHSYRMSLCILSTTQLTNTSNI